MTPSPSPMEPRLLGCVCVCMRVCTRVSLEGMGVSELSFLVPQRLAGTRGLRRGGHAWSESTVRAWSPDLACVFPPVSMPRCLCVQRPHFVLVSTRAHLGPESKPGPVLEGPPPRVCEGSDTGSRVGLLRGRLARPAPLLPTVVPLEQECGPFPALPAWPPPRIPATQMQGDSGHLICPCGPTASAPGPGSGAGQARGCWGCPPAAMAPPTRVLLQGLPGCCLAGHGEGPRRGSGGQGHGAGVAQ